MSEAVRFTPTQQAILEVLVDGEPHTHGELHACLPDQLGSPNNLHRHLTFIRKVLRPKGQDILCVLVSRKYHYRWIRLLKPPENGRGKP